MKVMIKTNFYIIYYQIIDNYFDNKKKKVNSIKNYEYYLNKINVNKKKKYFPWINKLN